MNLIVGTANFGKKYGLRKKKISNIKNFFNYLDKKKIRFFDSAFCYHGSHKVIIESKLKKIKLITKLDLKKKTFNQIKNSILKLKNKLGKNNQIYAILIHNVNDFVTFRQKKKLLDLLEDLKKKRIINNIGVSLYNPEELKYIIKFFTPKIIQIPLNVFDNRLIKSKWILNYIKKKNIEIHARSCFLQGLLLKKNPPKKLFQFKDRLNFFFKWCEDNHLSYISACLNYVKKFKEIKYLVVGSDSINQFKQIHSIFNSKKILKVPSFSQKNIEKMIDPRLW